MKIMRVIPVLATVAVATFLLMPRSACSCITRQNDFILEHQLGYETTQAEKAAKLVSEYEGLHLSYEIQKIADGKELHKTVKAPDGIDEIELSMLDVNRFLYREYKPYDGCPAIPETTKEQPYSCTIELADSYIAATGWKISFTVMPERVLKNAKAEHFTRVFGITF